MLVFGALGMIAGFGLAGLSTQIKQNSDRMELCAGAGFISGCVLFGAALRLVC